MSLVSVKRDISKNTDMTATDGMSDFESMATPPTNGNTPKESDIASGQRDLKTKTKGNWEG